MDERCRCDGRALNGSDHCPECFCEQFEERCDWSQPFEDRADGEKWAQALREGRRMGGRD